MNHKGTVTLETQRLILRRFSPEDAEPMFRNWANDPDVTMFLTWPPHGTIDNTKKVIGLWVNSYEELLNYSWAIELKSLGEPIGSIAAMKPNNKVNSVDMGYCIGKAWWGQGYVAEALRTIVEFLFEDVGVNRINAVHDPRNPNSGVVMRKAGFTFEAAKRQAGCNNQGICDHCEYRYLAEDYFKEKKADEQDPFSNRTYIENHPISAKAIADLRLSVGWNGMEACYVNPLMTSYLHIACYDGEKLIGYVDSVSNGVTDAYIQDLMVNPEYQERGIGTELMNRIIEMLKERSIYMISVIYGDAELAPFYKRFGFTQMFCGQMQMYDMY